MSNWPCINIGCFTSTLHVPLNEPVNDDPPFPFDQPEILNVNFQAK